jgi:hypothetical protein
MRLVAACILCLCLCGTAAKAQSQWDHNGSVVQLYADGPNRQFIYLNPRRELPVSAGTLLFKGKRVGSSYSGIAYVFSSLCGARSYPVSGPVSPDDRTVTLYGRAPVIDGSCKVNSFRSDALVFSLVELEPQTVNANLESTLICLHPVFTEERKLQAKIDGQPSSTEWIAAAINHLRGKYCRTIERKPVVDRKEALENGSCYQESGIYHGERVYWGGCYE